MERVLESLKDVSGLTYTIVIGVYIIALAVIYYFVFRKHHKRNQVQLDELINLVGKFYSNTIICTLVIGLGIIAFIEAHTCIYDRSLVIGYGVIGVLLIAGSIIYYIRYIKLALEDYDEVERQEYRLYTLKVGELIECIIFALFVFVPLFEIPQYFKIFADKNELIKTLIRDFGISFSSLFLLYVLNPMDITHGFKRIKEEHKANIKTREKMQKDYEELLKKAATSAVGEDVNPDELKVSLENNDEIIEEKPKKENKNKSTKKSNKKTNRNSKKNTKNKK